MFRTRITAIENTETIQEYYQSLKLIVEASTGATRSERIWRQELSLMRQFKGLINPVANPEKLRRVIQYLAVTLVNHAEERREMTGVDSLADFIAEHYGKREFADKLLQYKRAYTRPGKAHESPVRPDDISMPEDTEQ